MAATDVSSALSEARRSNITMRDGGVCVVCGQEPVDVAHIVARKAGDNGHVPFIHSLSPSLSSFRKDDAPNLLCLCPLHHRQYDSGFYVLVPSKSQRDVLINHELRILNTSNQPDPGRTFPHIADEIEYIHLHMGRFFACMHNPTRYDQQMFIFDSNDHRPCPLFHFHASPIALIIQAQPHLSNALRIPTIKADLAQSDVNRLIKLYKRDPAKRPSQFATVPVSYPSASSMMQYPTPYPASHVLPTIPSSPPPSQPAASAISMGPSFNLRLEVSGLAPSLSTTILDAPEDARSDPDMDAQADLQLLEYAKEQAVTWDDLKTRPPLFPGEEGGMWQFSSAEQVIRGEWH